MSIIPVSVSTKNKILSIITTLDTRLRLVTGSLVLVLEVAIETLVWWVGGLFCPCSGEDVLF